MSMKWYYIPIWPRIFSERSLKHNLVKRWLGRFICLLHTAYLTTLPLALEMKVLLLDLFYLKTYLWIPSQWWMSSFQVQTFYDDLGREVFCRRDRWCFRRVQDWRWNDWRRTSEEHYGGQERRITSCCDNYWPSTIKNNSTIIVWKEIFMCIDKNRAEPRHKVCKLKTFSPFKCFLVSGVILRWH